MELMFLTASLPYSWLEMASCKPSDFLIDSCFIKQQQKQKHLKKISEASLNTQRRHTNGQQVCERMLTITNNQRSAN
jgi:hypothetical protein